MNVSPDLGVDGSGCCWDCGGLKQSHDEASKIDGDPALITDVLWKSSWKVDVEIITWWCRCQPLGLSPIYAISFIDLAFSQSRQQFQKSQLRQICETGSKLAQKLEVLENSVTNAAQSKHLEKEWAPFKSPDVKSP